MSVDKRRRRSNPPSLGPRFSKARSTSCTTSSSRGSTGRSGAPEEAVKAGGGHGVPDAAVGSSRCLDANHAADAKAGQGNDPRVPRPGSGHSRADGERRAPMWRSVPIWVAAVPPSLGSVGASDGPPSFSNPKKRPKPGNRYRSATPTFRYDRYVSAILDWYRSRMPSRCAHLVQGNPSRPKPYEATPRARPAVGAAPTSRGCFGTMRVPGLSDRDEA